MSHSLKIPLFLSGLVLVTVIISLKFGAVSLNWEQLWAGLHNQGVFAFTIHEYRFPRAIVAILVGAMLATAGVLIQGVIRNPLASPDILGVSHGAGLAAVLMMTLFPAISVFWLPWVALAGGVGSAVVLALLVRGNLAPVKLAVTGVALAAFYASAIDFTMLIHPLDINNALLWLTGSLWGRSWEQIQLLLPWCLLLPLALGMSHPLNILVLGDQRATSLGVTVRITRFIALAIAVGWTSAAVAICGPISFLGLIAPHLARQLVGGKHQILLPTGMLVGALILLVADFVSRVIDPPIELPAGILTAAIGAPYFLYLLVKMR
ncbi:Fe(3+) dicitrate ABC transporter permease subunit FecD [Vibrio mangrovi]|uniref:Fe(3+) dicitrate ABC transporter permease subunit FecD n=1 Tax=Vibrio mangrovi TaxID=474394 RepID=A0A1Y6J099_9VIBR|nr:Fe(3+) dicitrate ABC transporter permease subunit FecD [Vibrio mangrovi]MDW6004941.1 Fe(3+) dicitrate ABC transporter permease subunit FecD [Vibrio mangrovi]SMS01703.1 Fe(3+) dicitrate transport system permease protein FecD [Vibrio mangrovi]